VTGWAIASSFFFVIKAGNLYMILYSFLISVLVALDVMKQARDPTKDYDFIEKLMMVLIFFYMTPLTAMR
jgi:hypothetical protein